jgi:uncharacterized membrane protein (UPF0127 family)
VSAHFLQPYLREPDRDWMVRNQSTGDVLAGTMIPAFDRQTRNRGLLGRHAFPRGAAMVLAPCSGVHTWFMRMPIDVIFVARTGLVLRVTRALAPFRVAFRIGAFAVIELAAGGSSTTNEGDTLVLARPADAGAQSITGALLGATRPSCPDQILS